MRVQHNIPAMNSYRNYNNNTSMINKNLEKLSSGYKINRAGDDAAGLAISEKMRAQITGLEVAQKNAKDGISLVQTAEGALTEVHSMLNRMFELAEQSANGTYEDGVDRNQLQKEVTSLKAEINRIGRSANFNGQKLLDGSLSAPVASGTSTVGATVSGAAVLSNPVSTLTDEGLDGKSISLAYDSSSTYQWTLSATDLGGGYTAAMNATSGGGDLTITISKDGNSIGTVKVTSDGHEETNLTATIALAAGAGGTVTNTITPSDGFAANGQSSPLTLQIGDTSDKFNKLSISMDAIDTKQLGTYTYDQGVKVLSGTPGSVANPASIDDVDISSQAGAQAALDTIRNAINYVSDTRGGLGAIQNRLEHTINNLSVMQENMQDAESTIRDTDVASEMMKYTKNSILVQSAQAMLAQANQQPQGVLQLLQ